MGVEDTYSTADFIADLRRQRAEVSLEIQKGIRLKDTTDPGLAREKAVLDAGRQAELDKYADTRPVWQSGNRASNNVSRSGKIPVSRRMARTI